MERASTEIRFCSVNALHQSNNASVRWLGRMHCSQKTKVQKRTVQANAQCVEKFTFQLNSDTSKQFCTRPHPRFLVAGGLRNARG
jgi:hypothetical protein